MASLQCVAKANYRITILGKCDFKDRIKPPPASVNNYIVSAYLVFVS
jgi:hypothetical protein